MSEASDFGMWLTTRSKTVKAGDAHEAYGIIEAIKEWEAMKASVVAQGESKLSSGAVKNTSWDAITGADVTPTRMFLRDVEDELYKAQRKFPSSNASLAAATEELGELAKACLSEHPHRIYFEAVQLATMALRIAIEGDPSLNSYREHNGGVDAGQARGQRP